MHFPSLCCAVVVAAAIGTSAASPERIPTQASGVVTGIVVTDHDRPIAGALVSALDPSGSILASAHTGTDGRFVIDRLLQPRVRLRVSRAGFVTSEFGSRRSGRAGILIPTSSPGSQVIVALARGGVISGTVTDSTGVPLPGVVVRAVRVRTSGDRLILEPSATVAFPESAADDRGRYRIAGLEAGNYVVGATPGIMGAGIPARRLGDADLQDATLSPAVTAVPRSGATVRVSSTGQGDHLVYGVTFHPASAVIADASRVVIAAAEARGDVDIRMALVPSFTIDGRTIDIEGRGVSARLSVFPAGAYLPTASQRGASSGNEAGSLGGVVSLTTSSDGRFRITALRSGEYVVVGQGATATNARTLWIRGSIVVGAADVDWTLTMRAASRIRGQFTDPTNGTLPDLARTRVDLVSDPASVGPVLTVPAEIDATTGRLTVHAIPPGAYRLRIRDLPEGWTALSAALDGTDVMDALVSVDGHAPAMNLSISLSNRVSSLEGYFANLQGLPAPDCVVVVFSSDRRFWFSSSRRIRAVRPDATGRFDITPLPPGDYRLAAVWDVEPDEWFDPVFLDALLPASIPITLAEGERRTQDIRVAGGGPHATAARPFTSALVLSFVRSFPHSRTR